MFIFIFLNIVFNLPNSTLKTYDTIVFNIDLLLRNEKYSS